MVTGRCQLRPIRSDRSSRSGRQRIRLGAEDYADEILTTFEANLAKFIAAIQRGRERLWGPDEPAELE